MSRLRVGSLMVTSTEHVFPMSFETESWIHCNDEHAQLGAYIRDWVYIYFNKKE